MPAATKPQPAPRNPPELASRYIRGADLPWTPMMETNNSPLCLTVIG